MTFDIKKLITENNDALNEAPASLAAMGSLEWVVDKLRDAETALHKARQSSRKHVGDQALDRGYSNVVGKLRALRLETDRLEKQEKAARK